MRRSLLLASVCVLGFFNHSYAQTAAESGASAGSGGELGEIIVTATRRSQALSEVPIAVSAVTAESLERSGVADIRQLNQLAPSLLVSSTSSEANTAARIRGIGTVGDNPGLESSVAVFIDGVYRVRNGAGLTELGDIERIEVLRGPQGTLFGRNASAGLINVVTKKPDFELGGGVSLTYGNYDYYRIAGNVTGPLVADTLAARLDAIYEKRDGFLEDEAADFRMNNRDRYMLRGQLLFTPTDDMELRVIADYTKRDEVCCGATFQPTVESYIASPGGAVATRANPFVSMLQSLGGRYNFNTFDRDIAVTTSHLPSSKTKDWGLSAQLDWDLGSASLTSITAYRDYQSGMTGDTDYSNLDILHRQDDSGRHFKTFSQELRVQGRAFDDRLDWLVGGYFSDESARVVDSLNFGADYGRFSACRVMYSALAARGVPANCNVLLSPTTMEVVRQGLGQFGPAAVQAINLLSNMKNVGDNGSYFKQDSRNWALFTHNVISITDSLSLTLGVRYTEETKKLRADFNNTNTYCPDMKRLMNAYATHPAVGGLASGMIGLACQGNSSTELNALDLHTKRKETEWTGTGVLSYKFNDDLMAYVSYAKGFKAGGYNMDRSALGRPGTTLTNASVNNLDFDPEKVDAYEIGAKYSGRGFNVNVAAFRQLFKNFQLNTFNGQYYFVQTVNGCGTDLGGADRDASATTGACNPNDVQAGVVSKGIEVEAAVYPVEFLTVTAGFTLADTKYRDNLVGSADGVPLDPVLFLLPDQRLSNAPKYVMTSSFAYTPSIGNSGMSALFYADIRHTSDYNTGSDLFPEKKQDAYTVVNARIGLYGEDKRWGLELWAQNLFNVNYRQVAFNAPFQGSGSSAQTAAFGTVANQMVANQMFANFLAEPRTYGATLKVRF